MTVITPKRSTASKLTLPTDIYYIKRVTGVGFALRIATLIG